MKNLETGRQGESAAAIYLEKMGYCILAHNYRAKTGEIDLIAKCPQSEYLVFIEVKTRSASKDPKYGAPSEAVTLQKQRKIIKTALCYIRHKNAADVSCRFDVLEILIKDNQLEYNHIINAFGES
jgi:putative endonuclease